ncbi:MAG: hypothetical protein J0M33_19865 [Anaerolineae bacterium]|nr:hypothetical protein [Anaerolineae bacterium]
MIRTHQLAFHLNAKEANDLVWGLKHDMPQIAVSDRRCTTYNSTNGVQVVIEWKGRFVDSIDYASAVRSLVNKVTARHSS